MVAFTDESERFSAMTSSASKRLKVPRTLLTIMWRTLKETSEWVGSIDQVPGTRPGMSEIDGVRVSVVGVPPGDGRSRSPLGTSLT